jgi:hypothetical protein
MDQETLKLLTKVKVTARRTIGLEIDVQRLTHDSKYANEVLGNVAGSDNEDLVLAALTLQSRFGLLEPAAPEAPVSNPAEKYKFGARG